MSFTGGNVSAPDLLALVTDMAIAAGSVSPAPVAGGTLTINGVALGQYDYCVKAGSQTITTFTESDWFTATADTVSALIVVVGDLTIPAGQVFQPTPRKLFTALYVTGTLTLEGAISMSRRGANHAATAAGNLRLLTGTASGVVNPQVPATGGSGGVGLPPEALAGSVGQDGVAGGTGGGGGGAASLLTGAAGAAGTSFSGGSAAGGTYGGPGGPGAANGGAGGIGGTAGGGGGCGGGAGNPGGASTGGDPAASDGTGGVLIVIASTYTGSGAMTAAGARGGAADVGGGGSGGGSITVIAQTDTGPIPTAAGGLGGHGVPANYIGGAGGAGTARKLIWPPVGGGSGTGRMFAVF